MREAPLQTEQLFTTKTYKERKNYTIDSDIVKDFNDYAKEKGFVKSNKVQELIEDFLITEGVRPKKKT